MGELVGIHDGAVCRVSFACNNPHTGCFAGVVESIEFSVNGESLLTVEGEQLHIRFAERAVFLVDVAFETLGPRNCWVGNWCWDEVCMSLPTARALIEQLKTRGWRPSEWACSGPLFDIVEPWNEVPRG